MAHGALTPIIGLRLLALAPGLRHNPQIGQPGRCFSAYGHKFGINHLGGPDFGVSRTYANTRSCACTRSASFREKVKGLTIPLTESRAQLRGANPSVR